MRSYTDLEQSKKLAEILSIKSADMRYGYIAPYEFSDRMYEGGYDNIPYPKDFMKRNPNFSEDEYDGSLPCWSLAALLKMLKDYQLFSNGLIVYIDNESYKIDSDNPVDACVKMIIKLKDLNLL